MIIFAACAGIGRAGEQMEKSDKTPQKLKKATFAGGCFWCMEKPFEHYPGVLEVISGYTGGHQDDPAYAKVSSGRTGHLEAVQITYDPLQITYDELLEVFWRQIDPTDPGGQFGDRGEQYKTAIFYHDDEQKKLAEQSKQKTAASKRFTGPIVTEIIKASAFFKAENYHQDYYKKNPIQYKSYHFHSGRGPYLKKVWGEERPNK